jgi:hypothetical protein
MTPLVVHAWKIPMLVIDRGAKGNMESAPRGQFTAAV